MLVYDKLVTGSVSFFLEVFRTKFIRFITIAYLLFNMVEGDDFRDLIFYILLYFRHDNILLQSGTLISISLVIVFIVC
jgi:hypothetical protein